MSTVLRTGGWARRQPRVADLIRMQGAAAAAASIRCRKSVARKLGRSVDSIDRIVNGDPSSPVNRFAELLLAVDEPAHLLTHVRILAMRRDLEGMDLDDCRAELEEILRRKEPDAEHRASRASRDYLAEGAQRDELRRALEEEAAVQLRACALLDRIKELEAKQ